MKKKQHEFRQYARTNYEPGNTLFLTLTFAEKTEDISFVNKEWQKLRRQFKIERYLHVLEKHASGGYHIHALIMGFNYIDANEMRQKWNARLTITEVTRIDHVLEYLVPYLSKQPQGYTYYRSRKLIKPCIKDAWDLFGKDFVTIKAV